MANNVINLSIKAVKQGKIPFEIAVDVPNAETIKTMEDVNNNVDMSSEFDSVEKLMRDLNA